MRTSRKLKPLTAILALLIVLGTTTVLPQPATAQSSVQVSVGPRSCVPTANIFARRADGSIRLFERQDPLTDPATWGPETTLSNLWLGPPVALPNGGVFEAHTNGQLRYMQLDGRQWRTQPNGLTYMIAASAGWSYWAQPENRNQITADDQGRLFAIGSNGELRTYLYNREDNTWTTFRDIIDTGWDQYNMIVAAGDGVLYARRDDNSLFRFQYHHPTRRWVQYEQPAGEGWDFSNLFSIGADLLYGANEETGTVASYQWDHQTDGWETGEEFGKVIGLRGWSGHRNITADVASCTYDPPDSPQVPATENDRSRAAGLIEDSNGLLRLYFTESSGRLLEARQSDPADPTRYGYTVLDPDRRFVGQPSAVHSDDDETYLLSQGADSATWRATRSQGDWSSFASLGGWTPSPAQVVQTADGTVNAFAVTEDGQLIYRETHSVNSPEIRWWSLGGSELTSDFAAVAEGNQIHVVARDTQGTYQFITLENRVPSAWVQLPGSGFEGKPSLTLDSSGQLRLFARGGDARIQELREGSLADGWAPVGDREFVGGPATLLRTSDRATIVARGTDDYLWVSVQDALDDSQYGDWTRLVDRRTGLAYRTSTDAAVLRNSDGYLLIAFLDLADQLYVFRSAYSDSVGMASEHVTAAEVDEEPLTEFDGGPVEITEMR